MTEAETACGITAEPVGVNATTSAVVGVGTTAPASVTESVTEETATSGGGSSSAGVVSTCPMET